MRGAIFVIALGLMICFVGWMFFTDFLLFDILVMLALIAVKLVAIMIIAIVIIWVLKELF